MKFAVASSSAATVPEPAQLRLLDLVRKTGGEFEVRVQGQSMGDVLPDGSTVRIVVKKEPATRHYDCGEVVVFRSPEGRLVSHRIIDRGRSIFREHYLITRGDACTLCDVPVNVSEVIGAVSHVRTTEGWETVAGPRQIPLPRRLVATPVAFAVGCWAFCTTPRWRRLLTRALWSIRGGRGDAA